VTPDGKRAISASWDSTLKVWDLETGQALRTLEGHSGWVHDVAVAPDGKRAVSASDDKTLGSEQEFDRTPAGMSLVDWGVSVNWRGETR
jgi:DNA-binding beta-propeller fold protein YncE